MIMRYRLVVAALVAAAFVVSACDDPAPTELSPDTTASLYATPKKAIPVTGIYDARHPTIPGRVNLLNPECVTVDAVAGMLYFKNCMTLGTSSGDLVGDFLFTIDGWQALATGVGESHAHHAMTVCDADLSCGAFEGVLRAEHAPGGQTTVTASGHGTGDFHTLQIRIVMVERGSTSIFDWEGVIF
jgi:hypothetical protein